MVARMKLWFALVVLAGLGSVACTEVGESALVTDPLFAVPHGRVSYEDHIVPIFDSYSCGTCHKATNTKGGLDMTSYTTLALGGDDGLDIVPCDHAASPLYQLVADCSMPDGGKRHGRCLDEGELATIAKWIDQGGQEAYVEGTCPNPPLD